MIISVVSRGFNSEFRFYWIIFLLPYSPFFKHNGATSSRLSQPYQQQSSRGWRSLDVGPCLMHHTSASGLTRSCGRCLRLSCMLLAPDGGVSSSGCLFALLD